jgi:ribonuclease P protein component
MTKPAGGNRLPKAFRLSGHSAPDRLFALGQVLKAWPLRMVFTQVPPQGREPLPRVVITVSKRQVKLAKDRNKLRRRLRDIYRRHVRTALLPTVQATGQDLHIALVYTGGTAKISPEELEKKLSSALQRLAKEIGRQRAETLPPVA